MKRNAIRVCEVVSTCVMVYGIILMFTVRAEAYIDPSAMTYIIQAIAGVVIALGAAISIYFRKAKRKLNEKLNIDENRNKEIESDNIEIFDGEAK